MTMKLFDRSDLAWSNGHNTCRCRCVDNHTVGNPMVCRLVAPDGQDVCDACLTAVDPAPKKAAARARG